MSGRLDLRLAVVAGVAWTAAALLLHASSPLVTTVAVLGVAAALPAAALRRRWTLAIAVGLTVGAAATGVHLAALRTGPVAELAPARPSVDVRLHLVRDPVVVHSHRGRRLVVADATVDEVRRPTGRWRPDRAAIVVFAVDGAWLGLLPGQRLEISGRLGRPRPDDFVAATLLARGPPRLLGRPSLLQRLAGSVRDRLRRACSALPADERGLVPGLVLGDVSQMPGSLTTDFRLTGLAHLTAVSGANLAIFLGTVLSAVRWSGVGRRVRAVVCGVALVGFVVLVRPSPSVLRAAAMGAVVLVAGVTGRRSRALPAVAAAVLGLVAVDPFLARSPGFAMSVLATTAIVTVGPPLTARLSRSLPRPLAAAVAVPTAAQVACTPVIVATFGQLTPYAVPANLLAAPAVAPATLAGIGCAFLGVALPPLAGVTAWAAGLPAAWLVLVARAGAALPWAGMSWPTGNRGLLLLAGCAVAGLAAWGVAKRLRRAILG